MRRRGTKVPYSPTNPLNQQRLNTDSHYPRGPAASYPVLSDFWPLAAPVASLVTGAPSNHPKQEQSGTYVTPFRPGPARALRPRQRGDGCFAPSGEVGGQKVSKPRSIPTPERGSPSTNAKTLPNSLSAMAAAYGRGGKKEEEERRRHGWRGRH